MAFRVISSSEVSNQEIGLGISLANEFKNLTKVNYITRDQITANIKNLLLTRVGERFELPTFGTNLLELLFEPITDDFELDIRSEIERALTQWLPFVTLSDVEFRSNTLDPIEKHAVFLRLFFTYDPLATITVTITLDEPGILGIE